jgi:hypothetical protein
LNVPDLVTVSEADNRSVEVAGKGRVVSFWEASCDVLKVGTLLADIKHLRDNLYLPRVNRVS